MGGPRDPKVSYESFDEKLVQPGVSFLENSSLEAEVDTEMVEEDTGNEVETPDLPEFDFEEQVEAQVEVEVETEAPAGGNEFRDSFTEMVEVEVETKGPAPAGGNDVLVPRQPFNTSPKLRRA